MRFVTEPLQKLARLLASQDVVLLISQMKRIPFKQKNEVLNPASFRQGLPGDLRDDGKRRAEFL